MGVNLYSTYLSNIGADRIQAIKIIEDLRYGRSFRHYENAYVEASKVMALTESERKKLFIDHIYMEKLISEQINLAPVLENLDYTSKSKVNQLRENRMKKALNENKWAEQLNRLTYDNLVSAGDSFYEIYFLKNDPIPRLKNLPAKYMEDILTDDYGRVIAYIYKQAVVNESMNMYSNTASIDRRSQRIVTWIFERGKTTILDPINVLKTDEGEVIYEYDDNGTILRDSKGEKIPKIKPIVKPNKASLRDEFMLLHIPSIKREGDCFSDIIATRIIDNCLKIAQITTDYRYTNKLAGFPVNFLIDGRVIIEESSRSPGGIITIESTHPQEHQAKIVTIEISNDLRSLENEMSMTEIDLYRKMFLFRPDVEIEAAKSDSSLVQQQLRLSLEKFLDKLVRNINQCFAIPFFRIVQKSYGYKNQYDFKFKIPDPIIETSKQSKLLQEIQEVNAGFKSLTKIWEDRGYSQEEINQLKKEINLEFYEKGKDISIDGLDNNFKSSN